MPFGFRRLATSRGFVHIRLLALFLAAAVSAIAMPLTAIAKEESEVPGAPHLLPDDTLLYVRVDNADEFRQSLRDSSIGRMLADPKLKPFAGDMYSTAAELFDRISSEVGVSLDELLAIPSGQVSAAMIPGNLPETDADAADQDQKQDESPEAIRRRIERKRRSQNALAGLFIVESGKQTDDMMAIVGRIEQRLLDAGYIRRNRTMDDVELVLLMPPRPGRPQIEYFQHQQTVVFGIGYRTAEAALEQWLGKSDAPTMADNARFANVMSRCVGAEDSRPQLTFFADPYHVAERLVKRGGAAALVWPLLEELGISKIQGIGGSTFSGGETFDDINHLHVLIDAPRDGFFGVLRPQTVDIVPPNWVPSDVTAYTTLQWDFAKTYENLNKILAVFQGDDPLPRLVEQPFLEATGIDIQQDVLSNLSGRYVSVTWLEQPVKLNSQITARGFELKDPEAAKAVIAKFREKRPQALSVETVAGSVIYTSTRSRRNVPAALRQPEPSMAILGDWLIVGDSRNFLTRMIQANSGSRGRLIEVSEFDLVASELGGKLDGEKPFMVSFVRGADYFRQLYELAKSNDSRQFLRSVGERNVVVKNFSDMLSRNELPPYEEFEKYFAPGGVFGYDEPTGIHFGSFNLKPAELVGRHRRVHGALPYGDIQADVTVGGRSCGFLLIAPVV
ncbi:putative secreted protein [Rhodopirellula maiorica SM1]|uniref:Putative secreted protein n=1 Tax=Rhodopirellula maiorica SM1 TaxID=1265738 RepID=M5S5H1_9BACT|nr:hypothetical protein [Rhodopirellula maiorica]EMI21439.1 putative secreted protein [Rhodopirellula maiorica SM1]